MIDWGIIITGGIGLLTTVTSSLTTWLLARKKYNSEVDNNIILNMQESLEFYKQLSDDNKARLEEVLERNKRLEERDAILEKEVRDLRAQMFKLMDSICTDLTCLLRLKDIKTKKNATKA